jgi:hypothetical protein
VVSACETARKPHHIANTKVNGRDFGALERDQLETPKLKT